jgi:hypothetical protein
MRVTTGVAAEIATPAADTAIIRLAGVEKVYRTGKLSYRALRGVDLAIEPGDGGHRRPVGERQDHDFEHRLGHRSPHGGHGERDRAAYRQPRRGGAGDLYQPELRDGRWYTADEADRGAPVAVIGPNAAREDNLKPGVTATVRTAGGDTQVRIVGVDSSQRDDGRAFYVPLTWLQHATGWGDTTNMLWRS